MNKYQSTFTDEDFKDLPKEVKVDFYDFLETIPFVKWLVQPEEIRGRASDKPRYDRPNDLKKRKETPDGRIYVDITKPHILEDINFFRERALFFDKHKKYTHITPNPNPKSEYAKFWKEEVRRWKYGLVRPSDGEWIPGGLYFYWNYCPIWIVEGEEDSETQGDRRREFPHPWLGDYLFYHYMEQARNNGQHVKMLKTRGIGASFKMGSLSPRNMYILPGSGNPNFHLASDKGFLQGDKGVFGKVIDTLDWIATHTPLPKLRLGDSKRAMEIQLGYLDNYGVRKGLLSSVYGISLKDNPDKARGIRGPLIHYEEDGLFPNLETAWNINRRAVEEGKIAYGQMVALGCVCAGTKVWTNDGELINIEDSYTRQTSGILGYDGNGIYKEKIEWFKEPAKKPCYRIKTSGNNMIECSEDHPLLITRNHWRVTNPVKIQRTTGNKYCGKYTTFTLAKDLKEGDQLLLIDEVPLFGNRVVKDARLLGLMIGDGNCTINSTPQLSCGDEEIFEFVKNNYNYSILKQFVKKTGGVYRSLSIREIIPALKEEGLYGKVKYEKTLPKNIHEYDKHSLSELLGGYYDADGNVTYNKKRDCIRVALTSMSESLLNEVKYQLIKFGIHSAIQKEFRKDGYSPNTCIYRLYVTNHTDILRFQKNIKFLCAHKQNTLDKILTIKNKRDSSRFSKGVFKLNKDNNKGHFFIGNNNMQSLYQESIKEIEFIGDKFVYNMHTKTTNTYLSNMYITKQTGGVEGADFAGAEKLFYNPSAYRVYGIPNVFDKNSKGESLCGFFWGAYLSRHGCYDLETGEPDITKALLEVLIERAKTRASASDSKTITQNAAEEPLTPQEAIMRVDGTIFPVADLKEWLSEISMNMSGFTSPHYVGEFIIDASGNVQFKHNTDMYPIREFPAIDNKQGAVELFELPKNNKDPYRFVVSCLLPGEKVMTDRGLMNVEDVTLNNSLVSIDGNLVGIKNLQRYYTENEDTYTLKIGNIFKTTTFTKEHPIYVSNPTRGYVSIKKYKRLGIKQRYYKFDFNFTKVSEVCKGDYVKVPNTYKKVITPDIESLWIDKEHRIDRRIKNPLNNKDFWWIVGLWLGDGWCGNNGYTISISFNPKEEYYINKYKRIAEELFERKVSEIDKEGAIELQISFQQLNIFLTKHFGKYAYGKFIPEWVKYMNPELKKQIVLGYLDSDGCIGKGKRNFNVAEFVSVSLPLLQDIQDILFSLGIVSSLQLLREAGETIIDTNRSDKISVTRPTYSLRIGQHNTRKLGEILDCSEDIKLALIDYSRIKTLRGFPEDACFFEEGEDYIYFRIEEIHKNSYTGYVYNFECDTHTYMCNYIPTHNCDPYDDDVVEYSNSLGSCIVFDRWTRRIVGEYTGRPGSANEFYEICYRMARFYNGFIIYENNKKGLFTYFNNVKKALTMLADTPEILIDKQLTKAKSAGTNVSKGINATAAINSYALRLQADWMLEEAYDEENKQLEEGETKPFIPNLRKIRSIGYLKEAIAWHPKLNADRISAFGLALIYDAELSQYYAGKLENKIQTRADDPFFKRVYKTSRPDAETGLLERITPMTSFGYKGMKKGLISN